MLRKAGVTGVLVSLAFALGVFVGFGARADAQRNRGVLEIRRYTANEGKLDALVKRMGGGEARMFEKHGMKNVFHAVASDAPDSQNIYYYVLSHESREAAKKSWDAFRSDPEWKKVQGASEAAGKIVAKVDSVYMQATDYSPMK
jgi:NIPSNAP